MTCLRRCERARLERLLTEGVPQLAAFSKRRQALEQDARSAAEALLAADAALRANA